MWRPDTWKEILARTMGAIAPIDAKLVEAGADAMLEALEEEANGRVLWFKRTFSNDLLIYVSKQSLAQNLNDSSYTPTQ